MSNPYILKDKRILIFQQRRWGETIGHFLAKKLQDEGALIAAMTFKKSSHHMILEQHDVSYHSVLSNDDIIEHPETYLHPSITLESICQELGIPTIWPMVMSLRNFVRSYREKYYYSFKQNVPDEGIALYAQALFSALKKLFVDFRPDIVLAPNFVSLPHIFTNLIAEKSGIPMLAVTDVKVHGVYIFTLGYKDDHGPFHTRLEALKRGEEVSNNIKRARNYIDEFRRSFRTPHYAREVKKTAWSKRIDHEILPIKQIGVRFIRGRNNRLSLLGPTLDDRTTRLIIRDYIMEKWYLWCANRFPYYPFKRLGKFVYFPLQFQPEESIDVMAPYFSNQIETARQVALSLPGDYTLVVKDHPAMVGLRPLSYLEKIARSVNVKLIDWRIRSETVLKKTDLVVSPSSTTIAEAAMLKKPAIQLGDLGTTLMLPNVVRHTDLTTLSSKILDMLALNLNTEAYERNLLYYVAAAYDTGFSFNYIKAWRKGGSELEEVWQIYQREIHRLLSP